jgi:hypothetical protein
MAAAHLEVTANAGAWLLHCDITSGHLSLALHFGQYCCVGFSCAAASTLYHLVHEPPTQVTSW